MKKIIDLEDKTAAKLEALAAKEDRKLKPFIEGILKNTANRKFKTELAQQIMDDGQFLRSVMNYFNDLYADIKGKKTHWEEFDFADLSEYYQYLQRVVSTLIQFEEGRIKEGEDE